MFRHEGSGWEMTHPWDRAGFAKAEKIEEKIGDPSVA